QKAAAVDDRRAARRVVRLVGPHAGRRREPGLQVLDAQPALGGGGPVADRAGGAQVVGPFLSGHEEPSRLTSEPHGAASPETGRDRRQAGTVVPTRRRTDRKRVGYSKTWPGGEDVARVSAGRPFSVSSRAAPFRRVP